MPNTVTRQIISDGIRNLVVKVHIDSDGTEETALRLIDASDYSPPFDDAALMRLEYAMVGNFSAVLMWDGTPDVDIIAISPDTNIQADFTHLGGLPNNVTAGKTGDVMLETTGIASGDEITLILHLRKDNLTVSI